MKAAAGDTISQVKGGVADACTAAGWNDAVRGCMLAAASLDALNTCGAAP